jgi:hypothetical protein
MVSTGYMSKPAPGTVFFAILEEKSPNKFPILSPYYVVALIKNG